MMTAVRKGPPPIVVFVLAAGLTLSHIAAYGPTFDEARFALDARNFISWMQGAASTDDVWFGAERPSPAKVLAALGLLGFSDQPWALRVFPALLAAAAAAAVYDSLRRPRGVIAAFAAVIFLVASPPFFGFFAQASNESVVTSLTLIALLRAASAYSVREWILVGLLAGFAAGTKVSGVLLVPVILLWAWRFAPAGSSTPLRLLAFLGAVLGGFLLSWPVLPIHPGAVFEHLRAHAADLSRPSALYFGPTPFPSWHYPFTWILIGLPPLLLICAGFGLRRASSPLDRLLQMYLLLGLVAAVASHQFLREGIRHLLPLAAVLAVVAGLGAGRVAIHRPMIGRMILPILLAASLFSLYRFHPTETNYISEAIGGPATAVRLRLPVVSSADLLNDAVLEQLPPGKYALLPGGSFDVPLNFDSPDWRRMAGARASYRLGKPLAFTSRRHADRLIILGSSSFNGVPVERIGKPLLARGGVVYVSVMENLLKDRFEEP